MAQYTQKAIMETFGEMLEAMPFDKITVSALVKRCGLSSNTFYYHYQDIYALLDRWLQEKLSPFFSGRPPCADWKAAMKTALHRCRDHAAVTVHLFDSLSRDRLEHYIFSASTDYIYEQVRLHTAGRPPVPEARLREISEFCRFAFVGFFLKFLWNRMEDDIDASVDRLGRLFDGFVEQAVREAGDGDR